MKYLILILCLSLPGCMLFNHNDDNTRRCPNNTSETTASHGTMLCNAPYSVEYINEFLVESERVWAETVGTCPRFRDRIGRLQIVWYTNTSECEPCNGDGKINGWYDACQMRIWVRVLGDSAGQTAVFHELCRYLAMECNAETLPAQRDNWPDKYQSFVRIMKNNFMWNPVTENIIRRQK